MSHPDIFYKYTTAETTALVLEHTRLRWSSPLIFNDLSEFQRMPRFEPSMAEGLQSFPMHLQQVASGDLLIDEQRLAPQTKLLLSLMRALRRTKFSPNEISSELAQEISGADSIIENGLREFTQSLQLETVRVLCVTTEFDNEAMWANYTNNHAGCVFGFRHVPSRDTPFLAATQVSYSEAAPVVGTGLDFLLYGPTQDLVRKTVHAICFTKKAPWLYEREWRVMTRRPAEDGRKHSDIPFLPEELESLTFGPRATSTTIESLARMAKSKYPECATYRLEVSNGKAVRHLL